jgi:hypothetical protein
MITSTAHDLGDLTADAATAQVQALTPTGRAALRRALNATTAAAASALADRITEQIEAEDDFDGDELPVFLVFPAAVFPAGGHYFNGGDPFALYANGRHEHINGHNFHQPLMEEMGEALPCTETSALVVHLPTRYVEAIALHGSTPAVVAREVYESSAIGRLLGLLSEYGESLYGHDDESLTPHEALEKLRSDHYDPRRNPLILVQRNREDGTHYIAPCSDLKYAADLAESIESPHQWETVTLMDIRTGVRYEAVQTITFWVRP